MKTTYHITYTVNNEIKHKFTNRIIKARVFISNNFSSVLACWREKSYKGKQTTETIFRNRKENEPKYYFNNKIKVLIK